MKSQFFNLFVGMMAALHRVSASVSARDDSTYCPSSTYTAQDNLHFSPYCGRNLLYPEIGNQAGSSITNCIDACSAFKPACGGVVYYISNQTCSFKDKDVKTDALSITDTANVHSALVNVTEMIPIKKTCPYDQNSTVSIEGLPFNIQCYHDMRDYGDYIPWGFSFRQHAASLGECMKICAHAHPLCVGVSWNPDKHDGFDNCYVKNSQEGNLVVANNDTVYHSGLLVNLPSIEACSESEQISSNNKTFKTSCLEGRSGSSNISSQYYSSVTGCIDQCAAHVDNGTGPCVGVLFDNTFQEGFYNCYLLNSTGSKTDSQNFTYGELVSGDPGSSGNNGSSASPSTPAPSSTPSSDSSDSGISSSKAWIAGPVIGALAAVAIVVGGWFWWRRRRMVVVPESEKKIIPVEVDSQRRLHELPESQIIEAPEVPVVRHELES